MSSHSPASIKPPRLIFSLVILAAALVTALVFASAFEEAPNTLSDETLCGESGTPIIVQPDAHDLHASEKAEPMYFVGGLWSPAHGLAATLDTALLAIANDERPIVCQSAIASGESLLIIDRSPIQYSAKTSPAKPNLLLSIDYTGGISSMEYPGAGALQKYITAQKNKYNKILIIEPLPGPVRDPDEDWTYLNFDGDENIDFFTPNRKQSPSQVAQALIESLGTKKAASSDVSELIKQLGSDDPMQSGAARQTLITLSPYLVVPALERWLSEAAPAKREHRIYEALMVHRGLGVHADALIAEAAVNGNQPLRALAARAIGDLAEATTDPFGKLTPLAEDDALAVRYEALVATRAMPGRRAAGIAQLVEPYEMTNAMRTIYQGTMQELLAYGEPVQADSKANRLRRMPINELLAQERSALVCTILLERTDLPDDKIDEVLSQLATANGRGPLVALLNLIESMNPSTLAKREVLLQKLVDWKTNELEAQTPRLIEIIKSDLTQALRVAAAAALIRSSSSSVEVMAATGLTPILFEGSGWLTTEAMPTDWAEFVFETAFSAEPKPQAVQVAALDAIKHLPNSAKTAEIIQKLLEGARKAGDIDLRFAAIRAINALPDALKPDGIDDLKLTTIQITAIAGMKYDQETLTVPAGRPVELTLINPDTMEHNLVITLPGRAQEIGIAMSADPTAAAAVGYVPKDNDAVLHYTKMTKPGESDTIRFFAPTKADSYEYVCTFPGHYTSMRGVLEVVKP